MPFIDNESRLNAIIVTQGEQRLSMLRAGTRGKLMKALKTKYYYNEGEVNAIGFKFPRYGVFWEKGVGKGVGMKNGTRYDKSKSRTALMRRQAHPWFSRIMDEKSIQELANLVTKEKADLMVKSFKIN